MAEGAVASELISTRRTPCSPGKYRELSHFKASLAPLQSEILGFSRGLAQLFPERQNRESRSLEQGMAVRSSEWPPCHPLFGFRMGRLVAWFPIPGRHGGIAASSTIDSAVSLCRQTCQALAASRLQAGSGIGGRRAGRSCRETARLVESA